MPLGVLPRVLAHFASLAAVLGTCLLSDPGHLWGAAILVAGLSVLLVAGALATRFAPQPWRALWSFAHFIVVFLILAIVLSYALYALQPEHARVDGFRAAAQTDPGEAVSFIASTVTSGQVWFVMASVAALFVTFPWMQARLQPTRGRVLMVVAALLAGGLASAIGAERSLGPIWQELNQYREEMAQFQKSVEARQLNPIEASSSLEDATIILIQGESASRHHMGLYGYFRDTTPKLSARQDLAVFRDVISPHSHTLQSLTQSLTVAGTDRTKNFGTAEDIISLARAAGLKTYWFSNQNEFGVWENPITVLAKTTDVSRFFSTTTGRAFNRQAKDHQMVPSVEAAMAEKGSKLIILHLFGSHAPYCDSYPEEFRHFKEPLGQRLFGKGPRPDADPVQLEQEVNCYDDTIRYADTIVDSLLKAGAAQTKPTAVLYLSDHGEAPMLGTYHNSGKHSAYHVEIPLILWANEAYKARYPDLWQAALANRERPFTTARLFHSLAQLMQISSPIVEAKYSLFSPHYEPKPRGVFRNRITYDAWGEQNDALENTPHFLAAAGEQKPLIWAHRVNSLGKLLEAKRYFSGIEMDLMFDPAAGEFFVYHPPAPNTGLTLEAALAALEDRPELRLWFDWKNARKSNLKAALNRLDALDRRYKIKGRALVETGSDRIGEEIGQISAAGYQHGYYLPTKRINECLKDCSPAEQQALADQLKATIAGRGFTGVTYDWRLRPFVETWLEPFLQERKLRQYSWQTSVASSQRPEAAKEIAQRMRQVPGLSGMLITFPSAFNI